MGKDLATLLFWVFFGLTFEAPLSDLQRSGNFVAHAEGYKRAVKSPMLDSTSGGNQPLPNLFFCTFESGSTSPYSDPPRQPPEPISRGTEGSRSEGTFAPPQRIEAPGSKPIPPSGATTEGQTGATSPTERLQARLAQLFALGAPYGEPSKPLRLREALGRTADRSRQVQIAHTFWEALAAGMRVGATLQSLKRLKDAPVPIEWGNVEAALEARLRATLAQQAAQFRACQRRLAAELGSRELQPLPMPADMFVLGEYRTYYEEVYAPRALPLRVHQLGRTLPIRAAQISAAGSAIEAAEDWWAAAQAGLVERKVPCAMFFAALEDVYRQEQALIDLACRYNQEIAEYALGVAEASVGADTLAMMLIGRRATQSEVAPAGSVGEFGRPMVPLRPDGAVAPATHAVPLEDKGGVSPSGWQEIPRTEIPRTGPATGSGQLMPESPADTRSPRNTDPEGDASPLMIQTQPVVPVDPGRSAPAPKSLPTGSSEALEPLSLPPPEGIKPLERGNLSHGEPIPPLNENRYFVRRPILEPDVSVFRRFPGLQWPASAGAVRSVAELLIQPPGVNPAVPGASETWSIRPYSLEECVQRSRAENRLAAVETYWQLARSWAESNICETEDQLLSELAAVAFEHRHMPGLPEGFLLLRASQRSLEVAKADALIRLAEEDRKLTHLLGLPPSKELVLPTTVAHVGGYVLDWERLPPEKQGDPVVAGLAESIRASRDVLELRLHALAKADEAWAATLASFLRGGCSVQDVLYALQLLSDAERAWITQLVDYNIAIARYAHRVLPDTLSPQEFTAALVPKSVAPASSQSD